MNKFTVLHCLEVKEKDYEGYCVVLVCTADPLFTLFFPIAKENAKIITFVLEDNEYDINTNVLGLYKTIIDAWDSSDRHLAGLIMDVAYNEESKDDLVDIRLMVTNQHGYVDSLVNVNFLYGIMLAAMENVEIIVSDKLLNKMMPEEKEEIAPVKKNHHFPEDKKIMSIAKKIMSGKIKDK